MQKKYKIGFIILFVAIIATATVLGLLLNQKPTIEDNSEAPKEEVVEKSVHIFDMNSKDRPIAVVINNTPVAVKVQEGLNDAYLIYEFPTEGNTSRLLALYQHPSDLVVGTIRSVRHNFIDYANENDAILVGYGWSRYARAELEKGAVDYVNGMVHSAPYYRNNPENLASEHTAYTTINKARDFASTKYRMESDVKPPLKYSVDEISLDSYENKTNASNIVLNYGPGNQENYKYNEEKKQYERFFNQEKSIDYKTKEVVSVKNILITTMTYSPVIPNSKYWDLHNTGTGEGYFITGGKSIKITWTKEGRNERTKYKDEKGNEIVVNDGRTLIALFITGKEIRIE